MPSRFAGFIRVYELLERAIVIVLLVLLMFVVLWATGAMSVAIVQTLVARLAGAHVESSPLTVVIGRMGILHDVFGGFLLILIGVELMKTVVMYLRQHELHVEVVFTVAMIAIARHAIDINIEEVGGLEMLGLAALVITLAAAYYLFRKSAGPPPEPRP